MSDLLGTELDSRTGGSAGSRDGGKSKDRGPEYHPGSGRVRRLREAQPLNEPYSIKYQTLRETEFDTFPEADISETDSFKRICSH